MVDHPWVEPPDEPYCEPETFYVWHVVCEEWEDYVPPGELKEFLQAHVIDPGISAELTLREA